MNECVLVGLSMAVKRHHDKPTLIRKVCNWDDLDLRGSVHYHHGRKWQCAGRHGAEEVTDSSASCAGSRK